MMEVLGVEFLQIAPRMREHRTTNDIGERIFNTLVTRGSWSELLIDSFTSMINGIYCSSYDMRDERLGGRLVEHPIITGVAMVSLIWERNVMMDRRLHYAMWIVH